MVTLLCLLVLWFLWLWCSSVYSWTSLVCARFRCCLVALKKGSHCFFGVSFLCSHSPTSHGWPLRGYQIRRRNMRFDKQDNNSTRRGEVKVFMMRRGKWGRRRDSGLALIMTVYTVLAFVFIKTNWCSMNDVANITSAAFTSQDIFPVPKLGNRGTVKASTVSCRTCDHHQILCSVFH